AISTRWSRSPVTRPDQSPSITARPSSSRPSSAKKEIAASSDSTTMPTLSIRRSATRPFLRIAKITRCPQSAGSDVRTPGWASVRKCHPKGEALRDRERSGSASCNGASECRVGLREGERPAELEVEPSGGQILTGARELLRVGAHDQRNDFDSSLALRRVEGDGDQTTAVSNRRERDRGTVGRRVGSGVDTTP